MASTSKSAVPRAACNLEEKVKNKKWIKRNGWKNTHLPSSEEEKSLLANCHSSYSSGCKNSSYSHRGGSLNVIIEGTPVVSVPFQESESIRVAKILKLNEAWTTPTFGNCSHKFINQLVILWSSASLFLQTDVIWIREKWLVIGSHVQGYRKCQSRIDPWQSRVKSQFANRNSHSICTQVTQAKDPLAIRYNDCLYSNYLVVKVQSISTNVTRQSKLHPAPFREDTWGTVAIETVTCQFCGPSESTKATLEPIVRIKRISYSLWHLLPASWRGWSQRCHGHGWWWTFLAVFCTACWVHVM